ncbi:MauE/DoxX family redox-associated membrane protein [Roseivirga sp.]|uniref:MauE/DoxX family redox-associated membrane protein n=1 Tax=Roseivirga sp. TaxID=1964215 RepID=UPI003B5282AC
MLTRYSKNISAFILYATLFIFSYSVIDKVLHFDTFYIKFARIPLIYNLKLWSLAYFLLVVEIIIVALLLNSKTRLIGQYLAIGSLVIFTVHILSRYTLNNDTCSCGGIFSFISLESHIIVNLLLIIGLTLSITCQKRFKGIKKLGLGLRYNTRKID